MISITTLIRGTRLFGRDMSRVRVLEQGNAIEYTYVPFERRLYIYADIKGETRNYYTNIVFFNVRSASRGKIVDTDVGDRVKIAKMNTRKRVQVRCSCPDYRWTFAYPNGLKGSLHGKPFPPYTPTGMREPRNPEQIPGLCKHLLRLVATLKRKGFLA